MKNSPQITVLIPVFNSEKYLESALESIRNQTFTDFECLIINDGSTDKSPKIITEFIEIDNRFRVINKDNTGVGDSLRIGVLESKGQYIARMDADDIAHPKRLEEQINYMKNNLNISVCGTLMNHIDENDLLIYKPKKIPRYNSLIKTKMLLGGVPLPHPTVFFQKDIILKLGNYKSLTVEDHELWSRIYSKVDFGLINKPLLNYRVHPNQTTKSKKFNQKLYETIYIQTNRIFNENNFDLSEKLFYFLKMRDIEIIDNFSVFIDEFVKFLNYHSKYLQQNCLICRLYLLRLIAKPIMILNKVLLLSNFKLLIKLNINIIKYSIGLNRT